MSNVISIQNFFNDKSFCISNYKRDYTWGKPQVEALLSDISEVLESNADNSHYIGTIVIAKGKDGIFEVVDGQQRLTTITIILNAFLNQLNDTNYRRSIEYKFLRAHDVDLESLEIHFGKDNYFVKKLFANKQPEPKSEGQRRLETAYSYTKEHAKSVFTEGGNNQIKKWIDTLMILEIIALEASSTDIVNYVEFSLFICSNYEDKKSKPYLKLTMPINMMRYSIISNR